MMELFEPLSEPQRKIAIRHLGVEMVGNGLAGLPTDLSWLRPLSEPQRKIANRLSGVQMVGNGLSGLPTDLSWLQPIYQPTRRVMRAQPPVTISFVSPAKVVTDGIYVLIDLVNSNLR